MSPTMHLTAPPTTGYAPTSDIMDRHSYGVPKKRKVSSTGGGRAWSEDEEAYLLQTRLQKMPYKHIAAHLKKTELACRLHYHQLSQGSNRRKRTTSVSSGSSAEGHSPVPHRTTMPSPIQESVSRSASPPGSVGSFNPSSPPSAMRIQLPSILSNGVGRSSHSPRLPAILPKPNSMNLSMALTPSPQMSRAYPAHHSEVMTLSAHGSSLLPAANFMPTPTRSHTGSSTSTSPHSSTHPNLRLDCSSQYHQPPLAPFNAQAMGIDLGRLAAVYAAHRASFWAAIAAEYGGGVNPMVLEQAWKSTLVSLASSCPPLAATPITPVLSPEDRDQYAAASTSGSAKQDKTRISAILGIDADPRSPKERELVRRLEERVGAA